MSAEAVRRSQFLSFSLAGGDFAVGILSVKEILQYEPVTRIPSAPRSVRGVINLRGAVVPVVDLALKLGHPETPITHRTCILIVEASVGGATSVMGVMADAVREVLELGPEDVQAPPSLGTGVRTDYLAGMGSAGRGFTLLLDLDRVLTAEEGELAARLARDADGGPSTDGIQRDPAPASPVAP